MPYSTEFGLFQVLEEVLKKAEKPMTYATKSLRYCR